MCLEFLSVCLCLQWYVSGSWVFSVFLHALAPGGVVDPNVRSLRWWLLHLWQISNQRTLEAASPCSPASDIFINFMVTTIPTFLRERESAHHALCQFSNLHALVVFFVPIKLGLLRIYLPDKTRKQTGDIRRLSDPTLLGNANVE